MRRLFFKLALLFSLGVMLAASMTNTRSFWGDNHLSFLPSPYWIGFLIIFGLTVALLFVPVSMTGIGSRCVRWFTISYEKPLLTASVMATIGGMLFLLFPLRTHFLGDGYTILSLYGNGDTYYLKWTEMGAILTLRLGQWLCGAYTKDTAESVLRWISVFSGIVAVFNLCMISQSIARTAKAYWFAIATLVLSGSLLLYFGYIEFYPVLWAVSTTFLILVLRFLVFGKGLVLVLSLFLMAVLVHLQTLYWLPGMAALIYFQLERRYHNGNILRAYLAMVALISLAGVAALVWLICTRIDIAVAFLPVLQGRPDALDYSMFSGKHLLDLLNLLSILVPGVAAALLLVRPRVRSDNLPLYVTMTWFSVGSCLFLLTIDPVLGLARDWDLMSLTLLSPTLLLLLNIQDCIENVRWREIVAYVLVCLTGTTLYLATNIRIESSEDRYYSLLEYYGSKNRAGWTILSTYFSEKKDWDRCRVIGQKLESLFPDEASLLQVVNDLANGRFERALVVSEQLYSRNPKRVDFLQVYASALSKNGQKDRAIKLYQQAIQLRPFLADQRKELGLILLEVGRLDEAIDELGHAWKQDRTLFAAGEGIALAYIRKGDLTEANVMADELLRAGDEAGAHLVQMVICVTRGDMEQGRVHFERFRTLGKDRTDYSNILEFYSQYWP